MSSQQTQSSNAVVLVLVALFIAAAAWAYFTEVDEIARGDGRVIPASRTQSVQATEPGVVREIAVKIGQTVKQGDLIVRLDDTATTSDLGEVLARARALRTKIARLELEETADPNSEFVCPESVAAAAPSICENEIRLLSARRDGFVNTRGVLEQRLVQREREKSEAEANLERLKGSLAISRNEYNLLAPMAKRKLVPQTEIIRVQQSINEFEGQIKAIEEMIPRVQGAIDEAKLQLREQELQFRQEALAEKTESLAELSVLEEMERGESSRVEATDIRSPVDGVINTLEVNTLGSFLQPGAIVAEIVPTSEDLLVEARISPRDIAFIIPGQTALVKITAFDFAIYGGLDGEVVNVGSDSIVDQKTGEPYFEARVRTDNSYLERNGRQYAITPGMICSVDVLTGRKTILDYLLKPINRARQEAFTER